MPISEDGNSEVQSPRIVRVFAERLDCGGVDLDTYGVKQTRCSMCISIVHWHLERLFPLYDQAELQLLATTPATKTRSLCLADTVAFEFNTDHPLTLTRRHFPAGSRL